MPRYSGYTATFISAGPTTTAIKQARAAQAVGDSQKVEVTPMGALDRGAVGLNYASEKFRVETGDLATALGVVSLTAGLSCTGGAALHCQQRAGGSTFSGGNTNFIATSSAGFLLPERLGASQDDAAGALLSLIYFALSSDGKTEPISLAVNQSLAGITAPAYNSDYKMGPAYLGSTQLTGVIGMDWMFGIEAEPVRADGDEFARETSIRARNPVLSLTFNDVDRAKTNGPNSLASAALGATLHTYIQRRGVAYAVGSHIKISISAGEWSADEIGTRENADGTASISVRPTGTISLSTSSTIP